MLLTQDINLLLVVSRTSCDDPKVHHTSKLRASRQQEQSSHLSMPGQRNLQNRHAAEMRSDSGVTVS